MLGCRVQSSEMLGCSTPRFVRRISCDSCRVRAPDARDAVIHALIVRARFDLVFHAPLALPRGCRCSLLRRVEPRGSHCRPQGGDCVWPDTTSVARPQPRARPHLRALLAHCRDVVCSLAATMPAIPSHCSPGWMPEGQLLRHWLRVGEVHLLPVPKELQLRGASRFPEGPPFFGLDLPRALGTKMLLQHVQRKWICEVRHGCAMAITNVSGGPEPTEYICPGLGGRTLRSSRRFQGS